MTLGAQLQFSMSGEQDIILHWKPAENSPPLTRDAILEGLRNAGFTQAELNNQAIDYLLITQERMGPSEKQLCVARQKRQGISLKVSRDEFKAWLTIKKSEDGPGPAVEEVKAYLERQGIVYGVLNEVFEQYEQQGSLDQVLIAQGEPPQMGKSAWFEYLVETPEEDPLTEEDGRVDFRTKNAFVSVSVGQLLMRRHPPSKGQAGRSIKGEVFPAEDGRDYSLVASVGSEISPDDSNLLLANREGMPIRLTRSVRIDNVLALPEVNYETGHVNFKGSVVVKGNVSDGFEVHATGDIVVQGTVEDAILEAGNHIQIMGSMFGRERAKLVSGGNITLSYAQSVEIDCMGDLYVKEGLFYSQARVLGEILLGVNGGKGRINGGEVWGGKRIVAQVIGSNASTKTMVSLGEDPYLRQKLRDIDHNLRFYKSELEQVVKSIIYIRTRASEKAESLSDLEERRGELLERVNLLSEQVEEIRQNMNRSRYHCELVVKESIMAGVSIRLAEIPRLIESDYPACRFYLEPEENGLQVKLSYL